MIFRDAQFSPHWFLSLIALALVLFFCYLGFWQLDRAEQKRLLADRLKERQQQPAGWLHEVGNLNEASLLEHRQVKLTGEFLPEFQLYLENRKQGGKIGFHIIGGFRESHTGRLMAVNRGWVAAVADLKAPEVETPLGEVTISGALSIPEPPVLDLGVAADQVDASQRRWPLFTLDRYKQWTGESIYPWMLLLAPDSKAGFVRNWPKPRVDDAMHTGYAIQWFGFALIVLFIWTKLSFKKQ